jgi:TolB-like protein/Tfp pilus assembly protein PilF
MKHCPECNRNYADPTLSFCLQDGAPLIFGTAEEESATAILSATETDEQATRTFDDDLTTGQRSSNRAKRSSSNRNSLIAVVIAIVAATAMGVGSYFYYGRSPSKQIDSIAVMPFINEGGNPDVEYLSDGMTETLIGTLSRLPNLSVRPRSSVFRYKSTDTNIQTIGKELGVNAVLSGRVTQRGDQLTLSLELIDVAHNRVIWSEQYNRKQDDIVSLQTEIARDVSTKLKTRLSGAEEQSLAKTSTVNPEAYQLYLKGRYYWNKRTAENIRKAMAQFQQAADIDPNYALAYSGLADCYVVLGDYTGAPETDTVPKAQAYAKRALALDGSLVEAQASLAFSYQQVWQWAEAEREYKRAIELDPNYATAHHWYNVLLMETGRFNEGLAEIKRAQELDPLSPIIGYQLALTHLAEGNFGAAIEQSKRIIDLDPNFPRAHESLGLAYLKQNRYDEAIAEFQKAADLSPNDRLTLRDLGYGYAVAQKRKEALAVLTRLKSNYEKGEAYPQDVAAVYVGLGEMDQAFAWLNKSLETRTGRLLRIGYHIPFEAVRRDPRYAEIRRRMGLPQQQI